MCSFSFISYAWRLRIHAFGHHPNQRELDSRSRLPYLIKLSHVIFKPWNVLGIKNTFKLPRDLIQPLSWNVSQRRTAKAIRSTFSLHLSSILKLYLMAKSWGLQKDLTMPILRGRALRFISEKALWQKRCEIKAFCKPKFEQSKINWRWLGGRPSNIIGVCVLFWWWNIALWFFF